jgi:hypothetical protein
MLHRLSNLHGSLLTLLLAIMHAWRFTRWRDSIRQRWDRDVSNAPAQMEELSGFIASVLNGRITTADSVTHRGDSYFGVQGPWYTVGWLMASTVERELGKPALHCHDLRSCRLSRGL